MKFYRLQKSDHNPKDKIILRRANHYSSKDFSKGVKDGSECSQIEMTAEDDHAESMDGLFGGSGIVREINKPNPFIYCLFSDYSSIGKIREEFPDYDDLYFVILPKLLEVISSHLIDEFGVNPVILCNYIHYISVAVPPNSFISCPSFEKFEIDLDMNPVFLKRHKHAYQSEFRIAFDLDDSINEITIENSESLNNCFELFHPLRWEDN